MITMQTSGQLPTVNVDLTGLMQKIARRIIQSVEMNFLVGGRPDAWPALKSGGETPLVASGRLMRSSRFEVTKNSAEVWWGEGLPYASIQNFGGVVNHPGSDKFQVFMMGGQMIFTWGTKPHKIDIPARPFMLLQDADVEWILQRLPSAIIEQGGDSE